MSLILNIDTALGMASISLSEKGRILGYQINEKESDHASWLHQAVKNLMLENKYRFEDLQAVALSYGPGSYTGLRIGMSAAKGFCYTLGIPLITIPTLDIMAKSALEIIEPAELQGIDWLCPMIDARRMEVYFAVYNKNLDPVLPTIAAILDRYEMKDLLKEKRILFFGNGSQKLKTILDHPHAHFTEFPFFGAPHMGTISLQYYDNRAFSDLSNIEPLYIKEFYDNR